MALEQRADALDLSAISFAQERCEPGRFEATIENGTPETIGVIVGGKATNDESYTVQSGSVVWGLAPFTAAPIAAPTAGATDACGLHGKVFVADWSDDDAATTDAPAGATGDEPPADWLVGVLRLEQEWLRAPTVDGDAASYDLRGVSDDQLPEPDPDPHPVASAIVCPGTIDQPGSDRIAFAFGIEFGPLGDHPAFWGLYFGAFRRGSDGHWRLLGMLRLDGSLTGANCAPPIHHP